MEHFLQRAFPKPNPAFIVVAKDTIGEEWMLFPHPRDPKGVDVQWIPEAGDADSIDPPVGLTEKALMKLLSVLKTSGVWDEPREDCEDGDEPVLLQRETLQVVRVTLLLEVLDIQSAKFK